MIQRIQSAYLFLIAGIMLAMSFLPVFSIGGNGSCPENAFCVNWLIPVSSGLIGILALVNIFLYKKRLVQIKLCYVIALFLILLYAYIFYIWISLSNSSTYIVFAYPITFPFIALILDFLTIKGIKKDEKLVKSLDRLR